MTETLRGIEKLHPLNHQLYRHVQKRVADRWRWEAIASECGLVGPSAVKELTEWVLSYREPKRLPMVRAADVRETMLGGARLDDRDQARKFLIWKRQKLAAQEAINELAPS